ncbi:MAG: LysR family transcriptional regulator [Betaproteobacteria bacterium]
MAGDRVGEMAVFVRAVDSGGFTPAARALGLTPSAVSKVITRLEARLGVRLLNRTTRSVSLTAEGQQYHQRAQRILAEIEEAEQDAAAGRATPRGALRMHVGVAFGLNQLPPVLPAFFARCPEVELLLTVTDRAVDLVDEGFDLAVRLGALPDSTLVTRRICDVERVICAAPAYLKRHGVPRVPEDLLRHNCLRLTQRPQLSHWPFADPQAPGGVRTVEVRGNASASNAETLVQWAVQGLGIVRLADMTVGAALRDGTLVPVLANRHHVEPVPMHAVMQPGRHRLPRVAAMVDFLVERFGAAPWRTPVGTAAAPRRGGSSA